jgi:hypothetical protein
MEAVPHGEKQEGGKMAELLVTQELQPLEDVTEK